MDQALAVSSNSLSFQVLLVASAMEPLPKSEQVKPLDGLTALLFFMAFLAVLALKR
jgi:hypothetical protein